MKDEIDNGISNRVPVLLKEISMKAIKPRSFMRIKVENSIFNLLASNRSFKSLIHLIINLGKQTSNMTSWPIAIVFRLQAFEIFADHTF